MGSKPQKGPDNVVKSVKTKVYANKQIMALSQNFAKKINNITGPGIPGKLPSLKGSYRYEGRIYDPAKLDRFIVVSIEFSPLCSLALTNSWYQLHNGNYTGIF